MTFTELAKARYSCRKYDEGQIEPEKISAIAEAVRVAPTGKNLQPQRVFAVSGERLKKLGEASRCVFNAPVVFVVAVDRNEAWVRFDGKNIAEIDATIVATHIILQAKDIGLDTCYVEFFDPDKVKEAIPEAADYEISALIPCGYAAADSEPAPRHTESKDISEIFFEIS